MLVSRLEGTLASRVHSCILAGYAGRLRLLLTLHWGIARAEGIENNSVFKV